MTIRDEMRTPPPEPGGPYSALGAPAWEHPLDRIEVAVGPAGDPDRPRWVRRHRTALLWVAGVLLLLGALAGAGAWMAMGLVDSARTVKASADEAQGNLEQFEAVATSDPTAAATFLDAAELNLATARDAADIPQMEIAAKLPYAKIPVLDLGHFLNAADASIEAGREALVVQGSISPTTTGAGPGIYSDGTFNLPVIETAISKAQRIVELMRTAELELLAVDGTGPREEGVPEMRDKALAQARDLRLQMEKALPLLTMVPPMLGSEGPRTYLVTILNQAEMRAPGGAPLSVGTMTMTEGKVDQGNPQSTSDVEFKNALPQDPARGKINPPLKWTPVEGDPFVAKSRFFNGKGFAAPFVTAPSNPDFRVAAESMARAWEAGTDQAVDGVFALDISALRELLRVTGPVPAGAYGEVNADNVAQLLLAEVYATKDSPQRHQLNAALMVALVERLSSGDSFQDKMRALASAAPGRHFQMWMRDAELQQFAEDNGFAGAVQEPEVGDHIAVYGQNGTGTKVDALQTRTLDEIVTVNEDGSAEVTRTVTQRNGALDRVPGNRRDERSGWATTGLIHLLPKGAEVTKFPPKNDELGYSIQVTGEDQEGRPFFKQTLTIPPQGILVHTITFTVPKAATLLDGTMTLPITYDPDNSLVVTQTRTVVIPPQGWRAQPTEGVEVASGQAVVNMPLNAPRTVQVSLARD